MWYDNLFRELEQFGDDKQAAKMSAYMQNKFEFLGIPKPKLKEIAKPYLNYTFMEWILYISIYGTIILWIYSIYRLFIFYNPIAALIKIVESLLISAILGFAIIIIGLWIIGIFIVL